MTAIADGKIKSLFSAQAVPHIGLDNGIYKITSMDNTSGAWIAHTSKVSTSSIFSQFSAINCNQDLFFFD